MSSKAIESLLGCVVAQPVRKQSCHSAALREDCECPNHCCNSKSVIGSRAL
jgi:hypothetical protein